MVVVGGASTRRSTSFCSPSRSPPRCAYGYGPSLAWPAVRRRRRVLATSSSTPLFDGPVRLSLAAVAAHAVLAATCASRLSRRSRASERLRQIRTRSRSKPPRWREPRARSRLTRRVAAAAQLFGSRRPSAADKWTRRRCFVLAGPRSTTRPIRPLTRTRSACAGTTVQSSRTPSGRAAQRRGPDQRRPCFLRATRRSCWCWLCRRARPRWHAGPGRSARANVTLDSDILDAFVERNSGHRENASLYRTLAGRSTTCSAPYSGLAAAHQEAARRRPR